MAETYDFSGYATKNDLQCSDGRIIRKDAFKENNGKTVPLVWQHLHNDPSNVLGHALLENRDDGVYAFCKFNDTSKANDAKTLVKHGDVVSLSIYANQLVQRGHNVLHGAIREVSLVLAGANPGASIDNVSIAHGDGDYETLADEAIVFADQEISRGEDAELFHADSDDEKEKEMKDEEKKDESKEEKKTDDKTVQDVINSMTEEQKKVIYFMVGQVLENQNADSDDDSEEEEKNVKHNAFDTNDENVTTGGTLSHAEEEAIFGDAKRYGSLRDSFMAHAADYGIENIDWLFPDAKNLNTPPDFIKREMDWVQGVINGTHHTPFSRIKSMFADITEDEARARGYIKGKKKKEEVFGLLKRTTTPTTIYKKQKLDRDDIVDITDFDVVSWIKSEMRMMLDEEIARAILVGDGRSASSDDKINESNIRPIYHDDDLYSIKVPVAVSANASDDDKAKAFIRACIKNRKDYKGSGNPTLYTTEDVLTDCLLLEDGIGHLLYPSKEALATTLRVEKIVTVPVMEGLTRTFTPEGSSTSKTLPLLGIIVNLKDYNVGADKGGAIAMFDDFDIDYNQQKYLIETRCSGALIKPYSAMVMELDAAASTAG